MTRTHAILVALTFVIATGCGSAAGAAAPSPEEPTVPGSAARVLPEDAPAGPTLAPDDGPPAPRLVAEQTDPLTDLPLVTVRSREGAPSVGPEDAPIRIVVFSDFQCPFCGMHAETIATLRERYGDRVRVIFRNYPLPFHPFARPAAEAALAAQAEGRFWEYHDLLFSGHDLSYDALLQYAREVGLDMGRFQRALDGGFFGGIVDQDLRDGRAAGVQGTPATFINGRRIVGGLPLEEFERIIDILLEEE